VGAGVRGGGRGGGEGSGGEWCGGGGEVYQCKYRRKIMLYDLIIKLPWCCVVGWVGGWRENGAKKRTNTVCIRQTKKGLWNWNKR